MTSSANDGGWDAVESPKPRDRFPRLATDSPGAGAGAVTLAKGCSALNQTP